MAAQVLRLPAGAGTQVREVIRPAEVPAQPALLPFPTPLLHPRAVEALLLAFRPLEGK